MPNDIAFITMTVGAILADIICAFFVGAMALRRRRSFWIAFCLSLLVSPIIAGLIVALVGESTTARVDDMEKKLENERARVRSWQEQWEREQKTRS